MPRNDMDLALELLRRGIKQLGIEGNHCISCDNRVWKCMVTPDARPPFSYIGFVEVNLETKKMVGEGYDDDSHLRATFAVQGENIILTPD